VTARRARDRSRGREWSVVRGWGAGILLAALVLVLPLSARRATAQDASGARATAQDAPGGSGTEGVESATVAEIARSLNCPLCQGYNLQDCPLPLCAQMREVIRERLAAGQTPDEVVQAFVDDYGPQILNAPPTSGFFVTAWAVPGVFLALAALAVAAYTRRASGRPARAVTPGPADAPGGESPDAAYLERLEQMLRDEGK
jgi:cytochrome c-type biogenesis protein CcmH/NrfF